MASAVEPGPVGTPPPDPIPSAPDSPAAGPADFSGVWEGPWNDLEHHQSGRLYLQVADGGAVSGWLSNTTAAQSYRLSGRLQHGGELVLACQCPPNQAFDVHVTLHATPAGDLRGRLALSAASGVFGQSHLVLRRGAPR